MRPLLATALLASALAGCSGGRSCDEGDRKAAILSIARSWYLYQDLLPAVSLPAYSTFDAQSFLDVLTARAREEGRDRGWSYLVSEDQFRLYYQQAQAIGFGFSLLEQGSPPAAQVFVKQVFAGSPAAAAGFVRGDEILSAGPNPESLTEVAGLDADHVNALISAGGAAGVLRAFHVLPRGGATPETRTMVSAAYDVDPVPSYWVQGTTGYVQLRTFVAPAEDALRATFAFFGAQGVKDVVVDLRYNGGGLVDTAVVLADLLAGKDLSGEKMFDLQYDARHASQDGTFAFAAEASGGSFERIAFVTTRASASASELVPNALDAYRTGSTLAFVGEGTYGKPVGQVVFPLTGCGTRLFLVSFRLLNAQGNADYFDGLPDAASNGGLCGAADDLTHPQDSIDEASTAAAVYFAEHGACPPASAIRALAARPRVDQLLAPAPAPEQRDMPGTF